jgi:hypothetical protein
MRIVGYHTTDAEFICVDCNNQQGAIVNKTDTPITFDEAIEDMTRCSWCNNLLYCSIGTD